MQEHQELYKYGVLYKKSSILKRWDKRSATIDFRLSMLTLKKNKTEKNYKLANFSIIWMGRAYDPHLHTFQLNPQNLKKRQPIILGDKHQGNALDWYIHIKNTLIRQQYIDYGISQDFKVGSFKNIKMSPIEEENNSSKQIPYFKPINNCYSKTCQNLNFHQITQVNQHQNEQQIMIQIYERFSSDIPGLQNWLTENEWVIFKKNEESTILQKNSSLKLISLLEFPRKDIEHRLMSRMDKKEIYWNKNIISLEVMDVQVLKRIQLKNCSQNTETVKVKTLVKDIKQKMFTKKRQNSTQIIFQDDQLMKDDLVIADCTYNLTEIFTLVANNNKTLIVWDVINTDYLPIEAFLPYIDQSKNLAQVLTKQPILQLIESYEPQQIKVKFNDTQSINKVQFPQEQIDGDPVLPQQTIEDEIGYIDLDIPLTQEQIQSLLEQSEKEISTQLCIKAHHNLGKTKGLQKWLSIEKGKHYCIESKGFIVDQVKGGFVYTNEKMMAEQRRVVIYMLKRMGSNIVSGKSVMNISIPVQVFDKESFIQRMARAYGSAPLYLSKLHQCKSNVEIIQSLVSFYISCFPMCFGLAKPFNPILGETVQGRIGGWPIFFEQILHHPPVSYFQLEGNGFRMYGPHSPLVNMSANTLTGDQLGNTTLEVNNLKFYYIHHSFQLEGLTMGQKVVSINSKSYCFEPQSQIVCEVVYNPFDPGFFSGFMNKEQHKIDEVQGTIFKTSKEKIQELLKMHKWKKTVNGKIIFDPKKDIFQLYSKLKGRWSQSIEFDGQEVWDIQKNAPYAMEMVEFPLPSDSRFRKDLLYFQMGNMEQSQDWKESMEEDQRKDRKLREKNNEK